MIRKTDKQRASYHNFYSPQSWGRAASYDLCINSSRLGVEETMNVLIQYIDARIKQSV